MIKHQEFGKDQARQLVSACFHDLVEEIEDGPGFALVTNRPDLEITERREIAKERISKLHWQLTDREYDGTVKQHLEAALAAHGLTMSLLPPGRRSDLYEGWRER